VVEGERPGAFNLFYPNRPMQKDFARLVRMRAGLRTWILPIPASIAMLLVVAARRLGLRIPVDPDQIRTLIARNAAEWQSDLVDLLPGRRSEFTLEHALSSLSITP
jgi:hypothetical protein